MENIVLAIGLFVIVFCFECCFFFSPSQNTANNTIEQPIEQQVREVLSKDVKGVIEAISNPPLHSENEIQKLTLRQARKVIAELNKGLSKNHPDRIRLKVNGKDQPKHWLLSQIKMKLKEKPELQEIIKEVKVA